MRLLDRAERRSDIALAEGAGDGARKHPLTGRQGFDHMRHHRLEDLRQPRP